MDLMELLLRTRSHRGFEQTPVSRAQLEELVAAAQRTCATSNLQPLKYYLSWEEETNARIQPLTHWAGRLSQLQLPREGHRPTAFVVICHDTAAAANPAGFQRDVGIVAEVMLLRATEIGLGGCMIGSFEAAKLAAVLELPDHLQPQLVIGLGVPDDEVILEEAVDGKIAYYRDEKDIHHVPKRPLKEVIIND